jgi:hypothetical protein
MKRLCLVALGCALFAAPSFAQTPQAGADLKPLTDLQAQMNAAPNTALPPVASLTCEQMMAELGMAGARMNSQLDPSFAANAATLQKEATTPRAAPATAEEMARNHARVNQIGGQLASSMQGIDVQRMMALSTQFSAKNCQTPQ